MSCIQGPRFAQFIRSNVIIKKNSSTEYTLTLCKLAPITLYQIVSRLNPELNNKRFIENINLGKYVELLQNDNNINLTSIMYINGQYYSFALKSKTARIIKCNKLRFEVTTSIIDNKTKNVSINLPSGFFKNAVTLVNNISYSSNECPYPSDKKYYNCFVSGNINIHKEGDEQYKITFKKSGIFTSYQIRNTNIRTREILNYSPKEWVNNFSNDLSLTSLMRLKNGCIYGFVLTNAFFKNNVMTWLVTTKQIFNKSSTVANGFKTGDFNDVIFNIDPNSTPIKGSPFFAGYNLIDPTKYINIASISTGFNSSTGIMSFDTFTPNYYFTCFPFKLDTTYTLPTSILTCNNIEIGGFCYNKPSLLLSSLGVTFFTFSNLYIDLGLSFSDLPFRLIVVLGETYGNDIGLFYCDVNNNGYTLSQPT